MEATGVLCVPTFAFACGLLLACLRFDVLSLGFRGLAAGLDRSLATGLVRFASASLVDNLDIVVDVILWLPRLPLPVLLR